MNANGNAIAKPIIQLLIHILKKLFTNPAFAAVMTNDMKNDISNAMQNDVKIIRFLLNCLPCLVLYGLFRALYALGENRISVDHIRFTDNEYRVSVATYRFLDVDARVGKVGYQIRNDT